MIELIFLIVYYVLGSVGIKKIISVYEDMNPQMAWVPFYRYYLLGEVIGREVMDNPARASWVKMVLCLKGIFLAMTSGSLLYVIVYFLVTIYVTFYIYGLAKKYDASPLVAAILTVCGFECIAFYMIGNKMQASSEFTGTSKTSATSGTSADATSCYAAPDYNSRDMKKKTPNHLFGRKDPFAGKDDFSGETGYWQDKNADFDDSSEEIAKKYDDYLFKDEAEMLAEKYLKDSESDAFSSSKSLGGQFLSRQSSGDQSLTDQNLHQPEKPSETDVDFSVEISENAAAIQDEAEAIARKYFESSESMSSSFDDYTVDAYVDTDLPL